MKLKILLFLLLAFSVGIDAQSPSKVLSQANKSLGGEKVLKAVTSRQAAGQIKRLSDGASGKWESQNSAPNLYSESFDLNGYEYAVGYNGKSGWVRDSKNGLRTLTGDAAQDFQVEANLRANYWLNAKADKTKITSGGKANVEGKAANVIILTTAKGIQIKLYFDAANGLLLREEIPHGEGVKINGYSDYRSVNGSQQAFSIKTKSADETYEIKIDDVKFNQQTAKADFDFPNISSEPLPDIKVLLSELGANADKINSILDNYSYTETRVERELDKEGNLIDKDSETTSLSFYKGNRLRRTIAKNGKPLSPSAQANEDKDVEKQIKDIDERIANREKKQQKIELDIAAGKKTAPAEDEKNQRISLSDALRGSILINPRRERFRGRDVIVFDYEPNPEFKPQSRIEKLFTLCTGAVWVDPNDKQVVRLEAFLTKSTGNFIGKVRRGASFTLENERINNEIWLPSVADVNLSVKILFAGININNLIKHSDYKRFDTEVKDGKVDEIKNP